MSDIAYCRKCDRIKHVDEDCNYLSCNPELEQREVPAGELYVELREMHDRLAAAEQRATDAEARAVRLATLINEVLDLEPSYPQEYDEDACVFCHAPQDSPVDNGNAHEEDCWIVRADAALTAPATQPDERAAAVKAVVNAAIADRRHFNECDACQDETCQIGAEYTCRLAEACDALLVLDATDGAAKEEA